MCFNECFGVVFFGPFTLDLIQVIPVQELRKENESLPCLSIE